MARKCSITGKKPMSGNHVSHAKNHVKRWQKPNIKRKRVYVPELDRFVRIKLSTSALRTINKIGLTEFLRKEGLKLKDVV